MKLQDELDLAMYNQQEQQKDLTTYKLQVDIFTSSNDGLKADLNHAVTELKETKILYRDYHFKWTQTNDALAKTTADYQEVLRNMISYDTMTKTREERIDKLKSELKKLQEDVDKLDNEHGSLKLSYEKVRVQFDNAATDLKDTVEKLHLTNKARHNAEIGYAEAAVKLKELQELVGEKEKLIQQKTSDIEEMDEMIHAKDMQIEKLDIKLQGLSRTFTVQQKTQNEKIANLNDIIQSE